MACFCWNDVAPLLAYLILTRKSSILVPTYPNKYLHIRRFSDLSSQPEARSVGLDLVNRASFIYTGAKLWIARKG